MVGKKRKREKGGIRREKRAPLHRTKSFVIEQAQEDNRKEGVSAEKN